MQSTKRIFLTALLVTVLRWSENSCASSTSTNLTKISTEKDETELSLSSLEESALKERYRRLIPHMTFYVSNNYVNPKSYQGRISPTIQRRYQYSGSRIANNLSNNNNNNNNKNSNHYYVNPPPPPFPSPPTMNKEKFIPSFQYDPKDLDNEEYFTPVRYNAKLNFDDYQAMIYHRYQTPESILPQVTTPTVNNLINEQQSHFTTVRPATTMNFTPGYGGRDNLLRNKNLKPVSILNQDFTPRPTPDLFLNFDQGEESYSTGEFETVRISRPRVPPPQGFRSPGILQNNFRQRKPNVNLNHIVKSLQLTNQLPEMLNADNIDDSIKTLVEILSLLNNGKKYEEELIRRPNFTPKYENFYDEYENRPKIQSKIPLKINSRPAVVAQNQYQTPDSPILNNGPYHVNIIDVGSRNYINPEIHSVEEQSGEKPELVETSTPNNYNIVKELDDGKITETVSLKVSTTTEELPALNYPPPDGVSSHTQNFPPTSLKYGATRGKPNVDYPAYATIPKTEFSCTAQRYKGFFGDPDTGCQVWHYCDLNGGKASFLCPNGTIFSQVALTCDWWFNVKCESTTQLYVLNERLYKYILPVMPKFPEDFTGPEVDRYLELKFKEMETKLKEKKLKKHQEELNKSKNSTPKTETDNE